MPNFKKILKEKYFILIGLLLTFAYNIVKGNNWAEILFTELIVVLFACHAFKMEQLCKGEEKILIPGAEGANSEDDNYLSRENIIKIGNKLRVTRIDDKNRRELRGLKYELDRMLNI